MVQGQQQSFENSLSFQISWTWGDVFQINETFIQQLPSMFTCGDDKDRKLSNQALAG